LKSRLCLRFRMGANMAGSKDYYEMLGVSKTATD